MAKLKTVHTPEPERLLNITFHYAKIAEFGRIDAESGWFKFRVGGGSGLEALCKKMGWQMPGDKTTKECFEGKLIGGQLVLTCQDKLVEAEVDMDYGEIKGFELHRLELEGRNKKGFRRELRFSGTFKCPDGAANFESYMTRTANAKGQLKVTYMKEEVQTEIPLTDDAAQMDMSEGAPN